MKLGGNMVKVTMKRSGLRFDKSNDYNETPAGKGKRFYANILKKMQRKFNPKRKRRKQYEHGQIIRISKEARGVS